MGESIIEQVYRLLCEVKVSGHDNVKRMNAALDALNEMVKAIKGEKTNAAD